MIVDTHEWILKSLCWVKKNQIKIYVLWLHCCKILGKANWFLETAGQWLPSLWGVEQGVRCGEIDYKRTWGNLGSDGYISSLIFFSKTRYLFLYHLFIFLYCGIIAIQHISFRYQTRFNIYVRCKNDYCSKSS